MRRSPNSLSRFDVMKNELTPLKLGWSVLILMGCLGYSPARAASNVAPPNILWHNKTTGQNRVWFMSGTNWTSESALPSTSDDLGWKMIGTGDFDHNGYPDILWQNENTVQN